MIPAYDHDRLTAACVCVVATLWNKMFLAECSTNFVNTHSGYMVNGSTSAGIAKSYADRRMRSLSLPHLASDDRTHVGGRASGKAFFVFSVTFI